MTFKQLLPSPGDFIQLDSSDWRVWTGEEWRKMTVEEQIEVSK